MDKFIEDVVEWDVVNWSKAIGFWTKKVDVKSSNYTCLELGGRRGGLSLWLGKQGNNVVCSDLESPEAIASVLHKKYACTEKNSVREY